VDELKITFKRKYLILNRTRGQVPQDVMDLVEKENMTLAGVIPDDSNIYECDQAGKPTSLLNESCPAVAKATEIFQKTLVE
jgi:CO dehydrogenase nickel-insertion accessory protein CooC1